MIALKKAFSCLLLLASIFYSSTSYAACGSPDGAAGDQVYNSSYNVMQYCNGSQWMAMSVIDSVWTKVNPDIYFTGGKVGIGTTTPSTTLHVAGIITAGDVIRLANETGTTCTTAGELRYNTTSETVEICNGTAWQKAIIGTLTTQGAVPFVGLNGKLAEDAANFLWDDANDVLTVGKKVNFKSVDGGLPAGEVSGAQMVLGDISDVNVSGANNGYVLAYNGTGWVAQAVSPLLNDLSDVVIAGAVTGDGLYYNGTNWVNQPSTTWAKSGTNVYYNGGNVGIGTSNPSEKLDVQGNAVISGNVGIGYISPSSALQVKGQVYANNASGTGVYGITTGSGTNGVRGDSNNGAGVFGSSASGNGVHGNSATGFGGNFSSSSGYGINATSSSAVGGVFTTTTGQAGVYGYSPTTFGVYGGSVSNRGVYGLSETGYGVQGYSAGGMGVVGGSVSQHGGYFSSTSKSGVQAISDTSYGGHFTSNTGTGLYATSTSGPALVTGTGNVGIGVAAPAAKLEVNGISGSTIKIVDTNQASGKVLTSDANGNGSWQHNSGLANVTGSAPYGVSFSCVTNAGYQNFPGTSTLNLPSAGTYFISTQIYYAWGSGCGDVFTHWAGSNIVNSSMDGKWQACNASGTASWNTYTFVITVSAATTLTPQYYWTNPGTSSSACQFGGAHFVKIGA